MASLRAFVATYPDDEALRAILAFRDSIRQPGPRWVRDDQVHLTLRFIDELPERSVAALQDGLARMCAACPPFQIQAGFAGSPWRGARVIALELGGGLDPLRVLQREVEGVARSLGVAPDACAFRPHLTLARIDDPHAQPRVEAQSVASWTVREVSLVQSVLGRRGATHEVLATFPLQ